MARRPARPGRTLAYFFLSIIVLYGLVALAGSWKPALGLDLQGGTRITLAAEGDSVDAGNLAEAARIIDQRVNGSGVTEAEVTTQNNQFIVVEIPGRTSDNLVETVKRQAQLRFRLVALTAPSSSAGQPAPGSSPSPRPGTGVDAPTESATPGAEPTPTKPKKSGNNRPPYGFAEKGKTRTPTPSPSPSPSPTNDPRLSKDAPVPDALAFSNNPGPSWVAKFQAFTCPAPGQEGTVRDQPGEPMITCDTTGTTKYLLSPAVIEGTQLTNAAAEIPQNDVAYVVTLSFDGDGTDTFAEVSRALVNTGKQFAIVLDNAVISAPTMNGLILDGRAQISGSFDRAGAESLATSLKFGSLPIKFQPDPLVETVGPSLAGNQLSAGITAGLAGLFLVMVYCLVYYRGLGIVVVASLVVAATMTYGWVLLLSSTAGFTLSLPGIAGLIVAVGITADSFIVYFERIRDEMRDGKSMRVAVEAGWKRARNTCLAADAVSFLAALVLYIFAAGVVKGFAFALGLSTIIDLVVFFWFTHPMVSWLAHFPFFNRGHRLSGLDAGALGLDRLPAAGRA